MGLFRRYGRVPFHVTLAAGLHCAAFVATSLVPACAQDVRKDLFVQESVNYLNLSEHGKQLYDGLTDSGRISSQSVIVRMRPIAEVVSDNRVRITVPGRGERYDLDVKRVEYSDPLNYKLYGTVGGSLLSVILTSRNGTKGGILQGPERSYEICDLGSDGQLLLPHETDDWKNDFCASGIGSAPPVRPAPAQTEDARQPEANAKVQPCTSGIRVLFLYPNNVSPVSATNHAYNIIDVFNQTVSNSGVAGTALVELAGVVQTTYQPLGGIITSEALNLSNNANAQALRTQHKADLVLLYSWQGYGDFGGVPSPEIYLHPVNARAFAVVSLNGSNIPVIGAHELSHLFGCNHNDDNFGLPYAKGFVFSIFNTLVAKGNAPGSKILYYSNPNKSFNGSVMGDATHNNAKVMNDKAAIVKAFRSEPNVLNGWVNGPYSGYEYQIYTYEAISRCGSPPYTYQWQESTDGINYSGNGTGEFHNVGLYHNGNHQFYLKLKITSSDAQVVETWMQIWVDDDPNEGYRRGQQESDSLSMQSDDFTVVPNPASHSVQLIFNAPTVRELELNVADMAGRTRLPGKRFQCNAGRNVLTLNLSDEGLEPGMYVVTVHHDRQVIRKKILYTPEKSHEDIPLCIAARFVQPCGM